MRNIAFAAVRILALFVWVKALQQFATITRDLYQLVAVMQQLGVAEETIETFAAFRIFAWMPVVLIAVGAGLWWGAGRISGWIAPHESESGAVAAVQPLSVPGLESAAYRVFGLVLLTMSLPELVSQLLYWKALGYQWHAMSTERVTIVGLQLAIGLLLLFGGGSLHRLLVKVREAGLTHIKPK